MTKVTGERQGPGDLQGGGKSNGMGFKSTMYPQEEEELTKHPIAVLVRVTPKVAVDGGCKAGRVR